MVIAQYRHPYCDLYQRNIIGEIEKKVDEPAVYRALEYGLSSRGLIGIIDKGSIMVRHTVTPIHNKRRKVIGALTHEYPSTHNVDTEPVRLKDTLGGKSVYLNGQIKKMVFAKVLWLSCRIRPRCSRWRTRSLTALLQSMKYTTV